MTEQPPGFPCQIGKGICICGVYCLLFIVYLLSGVLAMNLSELYNQLNLVILEIEQYDRKNLSKYSSQFSDQVKLRKLTKMFERLAIIAEEKADNLDDIDLNDTFLLDNDDFVIDIPLVTTANKLSNNSASNKNGALAKSL
ncbi:MAG: hypothetical protein HC920_05480 [Oscillatoriales cyanobacterium SM2_3_0]|nr:hypothetical protein [Oscillatoriales cyanobacterium SM2_3_0]